MNPAPSKYSLEDVGKQEKLSLHTGYINNMKRKLE